MAKEKKPQQSAEKEMSLEEAKAYRASLYKPSAKPLNDAQKREAFRIFWASNKRKYGSKKSLEKALWLHLIAIGADSPDKFSSGLDNFGLKKVK
jgi:hypothetical protein